MSVAAGLAACILAGPATAADATGTWLTEGGKARVRIAKCGDALCGTIVSLAEPNDPATGRPRTDNNNVDASKRSRPLVGVAIVLGMKPSGADRWSGQVYNAEDGKTYTGHFTLQGPSVAKLKGCAMAIFCKSQSWTRAN